MRKESKMKKFFVLLAAVASLSLSVKAQNRGSFFVGGTAGIGYSDYFEFALEPIFGYEIKDWIAVGTGLGMNVVAGGGASAVLGVAEPFIRFTPWHNDLVYLDLKTTAGFVFDNQLLSTQIGVRPGIRFRVTPNCDIAADLGLFGAQCTLGAWSPAIGLSGTSVGMWVAYRF